MSYLGQTNLRRPKCVICAGEITFRAMVYGEKSGMYINVLTMGDIINIYTESLRKPAL
jgi:hypothetical protein